MEKDSREPPEGRRRFSIGLLLGGASVAVGGVMVRPASDSVALESIELSEDTGFWIAFVIGGLLIAVAALILDVFSRAVRPAAIAVLGALIVLLIVALPEVDFQDSDLLGYGFVAGGLIVAVVVVFTDVIGRAD